MAVMFYLAALPVGGPEWRGVIEKGAAATRARC